MSGDNKEKFLSYAFRIATDPYTWFFVAVSALFAGGVALIAPEPKILP